MQRQNRRKNGQVTRRRRSRRLVIEPLETRTLLASGADLFALAADIVGESPVVDSAREAVFALSENVAEGESGATVRFRLEVTDTAGVPISSATVGQQFHVNVYVEDARMQPTGVFAAYLDIGYDVGLVTASPIVLGSTYQSFVSGNTSTDGLIDEAGAADGLDPLGGGEFFLFRVPFAASFPGTVNFLGNPADLSPQHDVHIFGTVIPVSPAEIDYGSAQLTIPEPPSDQIIDDGDAGFSSVGFLRYFASGYEGHEEDVHFAAGDSSGDQVSWTFSNLSSGIYRVSATWVPHANRATNAPYTINSGSPILVNQELAPNNASFTSVRDSDSGTYFADLDSGFSLPAGGTITVTLSDAANEFVIADAVRIERVGEVVTEPEIRVLDGTTDISDNGTVNFGTTLPGVAIDKVLTVENVGSENLTLSLIDPNSLPNGFQLLENFVETTVPSGDSRTFRVRLQSNNEGNFGGLISIANNDSDENPFDLNLQGSVADAPPVPQVQIIDDGDAGFSSVGFLRYFASGYEGHEEDVHFAASDSSGDQVSWTFSNLSSGIYRVSATWVHHANRATN
ncbi:MAG: hypothetical protein QGF59_12925, partial [Pirellulaceae bacterium]|nr:hypothetical protein [Pirellulaceae bacterium]